MGKISSYTFDTSPTLNDYLIGNSATGPTTSKFKFANISTLLDSTALFSNPYKFSVYRNASVNSGAGVYALLIYDTKVYDTGSNYSTSTGLFTATISGFYNFNVIANLTAVQTNFVVQLAKNSTTAGFVQLIQTVNSSTGTMNGSIDLQLTAGDTIGVLTQTTSGIALSTGSVPYFNMFGGHLVSAT